MEGYDISLHLKVIDCNGVKIAGFQGGFRYSEKDLPMYTQEESINMAEQLEYADIIVSHGKAYVTEDIREPSHNGLKGISSYLCKNGVPYMVHGHIHIEETYQLPNGTKTYSIYRYIIIEFKS